MDYFLGASLGGLVATVFAIPAIVLELKGGRVPDAPLIVDAHKVFGRTLKPKEAFIVGLLIHLLFGALFGLVYILFVKQDWLFVTHAPYSFVSWIVYAVLSWLVAGLVIYPALGMGLFGCKEGRHVWSETLTSHLLLGLSLWLLVQYYQPVYF